MQNIKSVDFNKHSVLIPDNSDYSCVIYENRMYIEYKEKQIAVISSVFDVVRVDAVQCSVLFKSKNTFLIRAFEDDLQ